MTQLLKGHLGLNYADLGQFINMVRETSTEHLIGGLFDYKTLAYDTWNKGDWLCGQCLEKFMRDHLHIWYLGEKVKRKLLSLITSTMSIHLMLHRRAHDYGKLLVWI